MDIHKNRSGRAAPRSNANATSGRITWALQGTSVLEIFVVGIPLLLLAVGAAMFIVRTLRRVRTDDLPPQSPA